MKNTSILSIVLIFLGISLFGQKKTAITTTPTTNKFESTLYEGVKWRSVGPFRGGRAGTVVGVPGNLKLYYMGTAGGGVWCTKDAGTTWDCISDGYFGGSIGAVEVSQSDPNVIYVGEGEQTVAERPQCDLRGRGRANRAWKRLFRLGLVALHRCR